MIADVVMFVPVLLVMYLWMFTVCLVLFADVVFAFYFYLNFSCSMLCVFLCFLCFVFVVAVCCPNGLCFLFHVCCCPCCPIPGAS